MSKLPTGYSYHPYTALRWGSQPTLLFLPPELSHLPGVATQGLHTGENVLYYVAYLYLLQSPPARPCVGDIRFPQYKYTDRRRRRDSPQAP